MTDPLLLDLPTELDTPRLHLRTPRAGDGALLHAGVSEAIEDLRQFLSFLSWVAAEQSVELSERFCRNAQANVLTRKDFPFMIFERDSKELVGVVGLHRPEWTTPKVEIGYWRRPCAAGKGYITEAVGGIIEYAQQWLKCVRIEIVTDEANAASRRVAETCGFVLEGTLRNERRAPDGSLRNTCVYAYYPDPAPSNVR